MRKIPAKASDSTDALIAQGRQTEGKIVFSFAAVQRTDYFNLEGTCPNWDSDLFETMQAASKLTINEIHSGRFSGKFSALWIHSHEDVNPPCEIPYHIKKETLYQIRISTGKGGVHGVFADNIFYVIWFDPLHNMYPDDRFGGLRTVSPASTCCKDRDDQILRLTDLLREKADQLCQCEADLNTSLESNGS